PKPFTNLRPEAIQTSPGAGCSRSKRLGKCARTLICQSCPRRPARNDCDDRRGCIGAETTKCSAAALKPSGSAHVELTAGRWMMAHSSISVVSEWGANDNGSVVCLFVGHCLRRGDGRAGVPSGSISMPESALWLLDTETTPDVAPRAEQALRQGLQRVLTDSPSRTDH